MGHVMLYTWTGEPQELLWYSAANLLNWLFYVNYVLFLFNIILVGFPMDAGRMLQCVLWPRVGYRQATLVAVFAGFVTCVVLGVYAMWQNEMIALGLCLFIFWACKNQWMILETGGDDALLGHYDFSQGYTSLERDEPPPPRVRRVSWWQRWLQQRAAKKIQRELEQREAEEVRMDELLDKIQREGMAAPDRRGAALPQARQRAVSEPAIGDVGFEWRAGGFIPPGWVKPAGTSPAARHAI